MFWHPSGRRLEAVKVVPLYVFAMNNMKILCTKLDGRVLLVVGAANLSLPP